MIIRNNQKQKGDVVHAVCEDGGVFSIIRRMVFPSEAFAWATVILWIFIIGLSIPLARSFQTFVTASFGRNAFIVTALIFFAVGLFTVTLQVLRQQLSKQIMSFLWTAFAFSICTTWTLGLSNNPEESIHFIEYGILSVLFFYALSFRLSNWSIYVVAVLLSSLIGTLDEVVQWFTPQRFFDFRDIWLNSSAGFLAQIVIAKGIKPSCISSKVHPRGIRFVCILTAVQIFLLAGCYSNTPARVQRFSDTFPFFSYLISKDNIMAEYGYRHKDPDVGTFYSRYSLEEIKRLDASRRGEAAKILQEFADPGTYVQFLKIYTSTSDPFLHELKVHLFRRDEYLWRSQDMSANKENLATYCTIAFRETALLEKYFLMTIQDAALTLPPEAIARLRACSDQQMEYESPVGANIISAFKLIHVLIVAVTLLVLLAALAVITKESTIYK
ncbi:MAG: VanZ family protein [Proteobacteria bacterium]|nr:VanZ family protein [Pseudomonadota bacterium]